MRVAVTYENGEVFQHFGHTEQFKIYEIENGQVSRTTIIASGAYGHESLAELLFNGKIDVLICGGIGAGAQVALARTGIMVAAGVHGSADEAVQLLIDGKLSFSYQANCDHHHEDGECGEHEDGECGCHGHDGGECGCH